MQFNLISLSLFALVFLLDFAVALPKISAVGSKFFTENGDQFYVKGLFPPWRSRGVVSSCILTAP